MPTVGKPHPGRNAKVTTTTPKSTAAKRSTSGKARAANSTRDPLNGQSGGGRMKLTPAATAQAQKKAASTAPKRGAAPSKKASKANVRRS